MTLRTDNERLRALIRDAEERGCKCGPAAEMSGCPWCVSSFTEWGESADGRPIGPVLVHADNCPAFSSKGVVR